MKHILGPCVPPAVVYGLKKEDGVVWMDLVVTKKLSVFSAPAVGAWGAGGFTPTSGLGPVCSSIHPL